VSGRRWNARVTWRLTPAANLVIGFNLMVGARAITANIAEGR
jgi:hypothetical protein